MQHEVHTMTLVKHADKRRLQAKVIEQDADRLVDKLNTRSLELQHWTVAVDMKGIGANVTGDPDMEGRYCWTRTSADVAPYRYEMYLKVTYHREDDKKADVSFLKGFYAGTNSTSNQSQFNRWELTQVDGMDWTPPAPGEVVVTKDFIGYTTVHMPDDKKWWSSFDDLYGLEDQIMAVKSAIEAGIDSEWRRREHVVLWGPPGCGKSEVVQVIKRIFGEEAVLEFDGTATTSAGGIKELDDRAAEGVLPRILAVEEIEKAPQNSQQYMLAMMDQRAEIRKTTARSKINREVKLFCIATVNNKEVFDKIQEGALSSRFSTPIHFNRPDRQTLHRILVREANLMPNPNLAWVEATLDFCEKHDIGDPRKAISIMVCGRDNLLTGEYQRVLERTNPDYQKVRTNLDWTE